MLLFSFQPGSTWSSDTFAVPPSQQPALQQAAPNISDFYSEAIATCLSPRLHQGPTPLLFHIHLKLHYPIPRIPKKPNCTHNVGVFPFPLPLPLEASTTSLQGRLLFQLSCEECHLSEALKWSKAGIHRNWLLDVVQRSWGWRDLENGYLSQ